MSLQQFDTPAGVNDLSPELKKAWGQQISDWVEEERNHLPEGYADFFFNETMTPADNGTVAPIIWEGFPRHWKLKYPDDEQQRWEAAEKIYISQGIKFRYQDEYLEWISFKENNKLKKVVFTCEGPEYWEFIAENDKQLLLELYRKYVSPDVQLADLFTGDEYNRSNKWNTTHGIMHLTQPNNTLRAEVNLAARASILQKKEDVDPVTDTHDLICCSGFGAEERFSDPTIGAAINSFVRRGLSVTLNNPIGLYISKLKTAGIEVPAGFKVKDFWKIIRGDKDNQMILRAEFSAPDGVDLESVKVGGKPLKLGAQLAEMIDMVIYGKAIKLTEAIPASVPCGNYCNEQAAITALSAPSDKLMHISKSHHYIGLRTLPFEFKTAE